MSLRCREGDLALITAEEPVQPQPYYYVFEGDEGTVHLETIVLQDGVYHPDKWLLPLRPGLECGEGDEKIEAASPMEIGER